MLRRLKAVFRKHIIQDVPGELARCEFDCRVNDCSYGNWMKCKRRILYAKQLRDPATCGEPGSLQPRKLRIQKQRKEAIKKKNRNRVAWEATKKVKRSTALSKKGKHPEGQAGMPLPIPGKKGKEAAASKPIARPRTRQKKAG
jgi:hypothetical protein